MEATAPLGAIELIHRIVGYPLAFIVAPLAIATFGGFGRHRAIGVAYAVAMTFLYVSGSALTLTRHPWGTWEFGRNVAFNLLGYSLLLHGWRSMWLRSHPDAPRPATIDRALAAWLVSLTALVVTLAMLRSSTPMHVFAAIAIVLVALDVRDWRAGLTPAVLYRRHARYMLGSYFYVLTVVSLVHLRSEVSSDVRWLWPSAMAIATIWLVNAGGRRRRHAIAALLLVSGAFGAYVFWEVVRDHGQVERVL